MNLSPVDNVYLPKIAVLDRVVDEIVEVKTFYWHFVNPADQAAFRKFRPGQFAQVSLFGSGEFPASLPPSPTEKETFFTVRTVGSCTAALHQLKPGDKLPSERELARQFGASRNAIREALRTLEVAGFIELQTGAKGGAFVREIDARLIADSMRDMLHLGHITINRQ